MELWAALSIGFLGSFHCIGMCGPLALALPDRRGSGFSLITGRIYYNLGRIVTYSLLGAFFGMVGHSLALAGFQRILSVVLGFSVVAATLISSRYLYVLKEQFGINSLFSRLKQSISTQYRKKGMSTLFIIGILNGLLPCGFVYIGLAGSLTTGSILEGTFFMTLFGLGTFPAMLAVSLAPNLIGPDIRKRINSLIPVFALILGLYLIYRGVMMSSGHG